MKNLVEYINEKNAVCPKCGKAECECDDICPKCGKKMSECECNKNDGE